MSANRPPDSEGKDLPRRAGRLISDLLYLWVDVLSPPRSRHGDRSAGAAGRVPVPEWEEADSRWEEVMPESTPRGAIAEPALSKSHAAAAAGADPPVPPYDVEIASPRPARLRLDLRPGTSGLRLAVQKLQLVLGEAPAIGGVTIAAGEDGRPTIRLAVPADQAAGTYLGLVLDVDRGEPCGTVSVTLR